jgi:ABC-2 type transport system permease protein
MSSFFTVTKKELQDHFNNWRFMIMFFVIFTGIVYIIYSAANLKAAAPNLSGDNIFLQLFTTNAFTNSNTLIPTSFLSLMAILLPVIGIVLGLDAINSEKNNGTLSHLVSQPIYRDSIINAKFLAGLITISVTLTSIILASSGIGILKLGLPPSVEEIGRIFFFLIIGIVYGGLWLGLAILFSTLFRQTAVSAVLSIGVWIFFAFFFPIVYTSIVAQADTIAKTQSAIFVARLSPIYLFTESMVVTLIPVTRSSSQLLTIFTTDAANFMLATPLSFWQSFISVWPQIIATILLTVICFVISYIKFMFEEIRAL